MRIIIRIEDSFFLTRNYGGESFPSWIILRTIERICLQHKAKSIARDRDYIGTKKEMTTTKTRYHGGKSKPAFPNG
jgi:hypothetical protein